MISDTYDLLRDNAPEVIKEFIEDFRFGDEDSAIEAVEEYYRGCWEDVETFAMEELDQYFCEIDLNKFPYCCLSPRRVWEHVSQDYITYEDPLTSQTHIFYAHF